MKGFAVGTGGLLGRGANFISGANTFGGKGYIGAAAEKAAELKARAVKKLRDGMTPEQQKEFDKQLAKTAEKSKWSKMSQLTATTGVEVGKLHREHEIHEGHERDIAIAEVLQQAPRYEAGVLEAQQKALEEGSSGLNYREATKESGLYARNLSALQQSGGVFAPDGAVAIIAQTIGKNLAASLTANLKKGEEQGMQALGEVLGAIGSKDVAGSQWTTEDDEKAGASRQGMQRKLLTALLGKKVEEGGEDAAFAEFQKIHGKGANAILKQLDGGLKVAAADGAVNMSGLFNDRVVDEKTNRIGYQLEKDEAKEVTREDGTTSREDGAFEANRKYWADAVSGNINKLKTVANMVARGPKGALKIDDQSISQLSAALGSLTPQTRVNNALIDSLKKARKDDAAGFDRFIKTFEQTHQAAAEALKFKLGDAVSEATKIAAKQADEDEGSGI